MNKTNKVKNAVNKTAREIPIIAWAVEKDGKIDPNNVYSTRDAARYIHTDIETYGEAQKAHVRKIAIQVIPGR